MKTTSICVLLFTLPSMLIADPTFFDTESSWQAAFQSTETFTFTPTNVALADEVTGAPGNNQNLGPMLTFAGAMTGYDFGFSVQTLETNANFTFNDNEGDSDFTHSLSVGDINNHEDDDFRVEFTGVVYGFGFDLRDSDRSPGEFFQVFGASGLLGSTPVMADSAASDFVGVVSSVPITHVIFDEDPGSDDIAVRSFSFSNSQAIPEPAATVVTTALLGIGLVRRRR